MAVEVTRANETTGAARWTRSAALGLLMPGVAVILMLGAVFVWGLDAGGELGFFYVVLGISLVSAFLVNRFGTWAKIVGIVAALLMVMGMFWTIFGLFVPASFFDFVPGILVYPGTILAIASCIGGIVATRRGHHTAAPTGGEARAIRGVLAAVVILSVVSAGLTVLTRESVDAGEADAVIAMKSIEFQEEEMTVAAGSILAVRNEDPFFHNFTITELDVDVDFGPNTSKFIEIPMEPGSYTVFCRPHTGNPDNPGDDDMAMQLVVE